MESQEQAYFLTDNSHLNYDANFCSLQSEVPIQLAGSEHPVMHELSTLETSALQESGIIVGEQQAELVGDVTYDDNTSMLENGKGPDTCQSGSDKRYTASSNEFEHMDKASVSNDVVRAGVCIGTIVSVHEQEDTVSADQPRDEPFVDHKVQLTATHGKPENKIDYGQTVAMEDFGGEFEDGHGIEESPFVSVNIFADSEVNNSETLSDPLTEVNGDSAKHHTAEMQDGAVNIGHEEQLDIPERLDKICPKSPDDEGSPEHDEEPPILEREVNSKPGNSEQSDRIEDAGLGSEQLPSKLPPRRSRRHSEAESGKKQLSDTEKSLASNPELNVNSRPRRSVNRKSVFELLHVDISTYRHAGGAKKVATHRASEGEMDNESSAKKQKRSRGETKVSSKRPGDSTERPVKTKRLLPFRHDDMHEIDDQISTLKKKVVGYRPDDFLDDGDVEPEVSENMEFSNKKATVDADRSSLKESIFAETDEHAARSFLSTFAAESAAALLSKQADVGNDLDAVIAENQELRSRIRTLEQSKSIMRKFNIDFHGRKFSRIRSPAVLTPEQRKTPGKTIGGAQDRTPATERNAPVEPGESVLSRMAVLDRREHKLRELSSELDERATLVKIAEGALRRRERKLVDFEKTLEHRERVLSRHEQSILKRELVLGSPALSAGNPPEEESEDRQSLAAEVQRRLEQRRLELDRRQALLDSERTRLETRERELNQREANSRMTVESSSIADNDDGKGNADTANHSSSNPAQHLTSVGNQKMKKSVSHSIQAKYLSPKKKKVFFKDFN